MPETPIEIDGHASVGKDDVSSRPEPGFGWKVHVVPKPSLVQSVSKQLFGFRIALARRAHAPRHDIARRAWDTPSAAPVLLNQSP
jgi:hypothetical protein